MGCFINSIESNRRKDVTVDPVPPHHPTEDFNKAVDFNGKYFKDKFLGKGGYSVVHLVVDRRTHHKYAAKIISRKNCSLTEIQSQANEVEIMRKLDHKHIIKLIDYFDEPDNLYIVLELMEGGDLFENIVQKSHFSEKEARDVMVKLLYAIEYCHKRNIVHRDLKPENLLLTSTRNDAEMKVADFGFACSADGFNLSSRCGTVAYMAPEIHQKIRYGKPVDLWAIGVIMFVLLGGYYPFDDPDNNDTKIIRNKICSGAITFPKRSWSNISEEAKDLIKSLLTVDMYQRLTVTQALKHTWIGLPSDALSQRLIPTDSLREYNKNKWKKAVNTVIAANRMSKTPRGNENEGWRSLTAEEAAKEAAGMNLRLSEEEN